MYFKLVEEIDKTLPEDKYYEQKALEDCFYTFSKDLSDDENEEHFVYNQNQTNVNQCDRNI